MNPPDAISKSATSINLGWEEPDMPNGVITEYRLNMDGIDIYTGTQRSHQESGLRTFNGYNFILTGMYRLH